MSWELMKSTPTKGPRMRATIRPNLYIYFEISKWENMSQRNLFAPSILERNAKRTSENKTLKESTTVVKGRRPEGKNWANGHHLKASGRVDGWQFIPNVLWTSSLGTGSKYSNEIGGANWKDKLSSGILEVSWSVRMRTQALGKVLENLQEPLKRENISGKGRGSGGVLPSGTNRPVSFLIIGPHTEA